MSAEDLVQRTHPARSRSRGFRALDWQVIGLPIIMAILWLSSASRIEEGLWPTLGLLVIVSAGGLFAIAAFSRRMGDPALLRLGHVFLLKLLLLHFVLFAGWVPLLDREDAAFGYDPQRYYFEAQDWIAADYDISVLPPLNYTGVIFYYGSWFSVFGQNPVVPALVNALVTLGATLLVVSTGYWVRPRIGPYHWMLGLVMLIPEIVWYDTMTSRETLAMALVVTSALLAGRYFMRQPGDGIGTLHVGLALLAFVALGLVRTAMLIPVGGTILVLFWWARMPVYRRVAGIAVLAAAAAIMAVIPQVSRQLGADAFNYAAIMQRVIEGQDIWRYHFDWSERSFGQLFLTDSVWKAAVFTPARILIYLIAPLPVGFVDIDGLAAGHWEAWQYLLAGLSSLLYLLVFPLAICSLITSIRQRQWTRDYVFHVPFWFSMIAIALGNQIISERYRISAVALLWACAWLGLRAERRLVGQVYLAWVLVLGAGVLFFAAFKLGIV